MGLNVGNPSKDLENVPEIKIGWLNVYADCSVYHHTKAAADRAAKGELYNHSRDRIACVKVVYTEGQFDE